MCWEVREIKSQWWGISSASKCHMRTWLQYILLLIMKHLSFSAHLYLTVRERVSGEQMGNVFHRQNGFSDVCSLLCFTQYGTGVSRNRDVFLLSWLRLRLSPYFSYTNTVYTQLLNNKSDICTPLQSIKVLLKTSVSHLLIIFHTCSL